MPNNEHLAKLREGVGVWNEWRMENPGVVPDLVDANLVGANLVGANLAAADLAGAHLNGAHLNDAYLNRAHLDSASLAGANLVGARLDGADLARARLSRAGFAGAVLVRTNLTGAHHLEDADLTAAIAAATVFSDLNLGDVRGLESVTHLGPSPISTSTFKRSRGQIPAEFLRGCGLSDWEIEASKLYDPDLRQDEITAILYEVDRIRSESPIRVNPLFISYSRADTLFVEALEKRLDKKRIRYWRDVHDLTAGPLERQIEQAIQINPTFLLVLSNHSAGSDWVEWEAGKARELEKDLRKRGKERHVLCPLALDRCWEYANWSGPLRKQIEKYHILDFSRWKEAGGMEKPFKKLLDGLNLFYPGQTPAEAT